MIKTRLEEIEELKGKIGAIESTFNSTFWSLSLKKPWHKNNCNIRNAVDYEADARCECGFDQLEYIIKKH